MCAVLLFCVFQASSDAADNVAAELDLFGNEDLLDQAEAAEAAALKKKKQKMKPKPKADADVLKSSDQSSSNTVPHSTTTTPINGAVKTETIPKLPASSALPSSKPVAACTGLSSSVGSTGITRVTGDLADVSAGVMSSLKTSRPDCQAPAPSLSGSVNGQA